MSQPITATTSSAADFVFYESFLAPRFLELSSYWYDIVGGTAEGQDGMVLASAKNALWDSAVMYLLTRRIVFQKPGPGPALHTLFSEVVEDETLLAEFDRLLLEDPRDHEEMATFAQACLSFVDDRLGMRQWREFYGSLTAPELYGRYHQRLLDVGKMAEQLDVPLPRSVEAILEGIRIRKELGQRVNA